MDLSLSPATQTLRERLVRFMDEHVYPAEAGYTAYRQTVGPDDHSVPPVLEQLTRTARSLGLWNLFLPAISGLTNVEYAHLAEITGRSPYLAPQAMNCAAPDTGNMELLHLFGTEDQRKQWLEPLLDGLIKSAFSMTEPDVASSDARNIRTSIVRDGDHYVINGRKWWTTGAADPRCELLVVMGKTDPAAPAHRQQSMILVPVATPGVEIIRTLPIFGFHDQNGHCEIDYKDVRVPTTSLLGGEGDGFAIAQARLGPGRIHHAMRCIGMAERALELMTRRAMDRRAFGGPIQIHGGLGVSDDLLLARMWASARTLRIADGPDEVHIRTIARQELAEYTLRRALASFASPGCEGAEGPAATRMSAGRRHRC